MVKIDGYIKKYGEEKYLKNMSNRWKNIYVTEMNNEYWLIFSLYVGTIYRY